MIPYANRKYKETDSDKKDSGAFQNKEEPMPNEGLFFCKEIAFINAAEIFGIR